MNGMVVGFSRFNHKLNKNDRAACYWVSSESNLSKNTEKRDEMLFYK